MRKHSLFGILVLGGLALWTNGARAEADTFGTGTGRAGPATFAAQAAPYVVNQYTAVTAAAAAASKTVTVASSAGFAARDLVLVWQTTGLTQNASLAGVPDAPANVSLAASPIGRYEFARVKSTTATSLTFTNPLVSAYAATGAQVVRVPEFTTVSIAAGATLSPKAWDGTTGGVIAFFATGAVTNAGAIDASRLGFRGGVTFQNGGPDNCNALDGTPAAGFGAKGEGIVPAGYTVDPSQNTSIGGRGVFGNAGGGGDCHNSGGGGGGHGSAGGKGGRTWDSSANADVGGFGGARLVYSLVDHLAMGGGGGAGDQNNGLAKNGGVGGASILIRAGSLANTGVIAANGETPPNPDNPQNDSASGGGAGGAIAIRVATTLTCNASTVLARGGDGGSSTFVRHGPGGGGGAGVVLLQGANVTCVPAVASGVAGTQGDAAAQDGVSFAATPTVAATQTPETPPAGGLAAPCGLADNACGGCVVNADCPNTKPSCDGATNKCVDPDADGDGVPDRLEKPGDTDGDGIADVNDPDDDGDGVPTKDELGAGGSANPRDTDGDGKPDYLDTDDDGDGVATKDEVGAGGGGAPQDTDGDGKPNYLDVDDDGDSIPTADELGASGAVKPVDTDGDGKPDYLDADDDEDGIPTADEVIDGKLAAVASDDVDGDGKKNWLDSDADGDGALDGTEGRADADGDGRPNYLDVDSVVNGPGGGGLGGSDAGAGSSGNVAFTDDGVIEGGGISCNSGAAGPAQVGWLAGLTALALAWVRRRRVIDGKDDKTS